MLIFFDIDGTLWDYKNHIPDSTAKAIRKARADGHKCFINTGRSDDKVKEICDHTTDLLENDGIWKAMEKYGVI